MHGHVEYVPRTATWRSRARRAGGAGRAPGYQAGSPAPTPQAPPAAAAPEPAPAGAPSQPSTGKSDAARSLKEEADREEARRTVEARRREIVDAFDRLQGRDHFELLGIERKATENEVKEAYFRLARRFHPDTPPDPSPGPARQARERLPPLGAAYETLRNAASRARRRRSIHDPRGGTPSRPRARDPAVRHPAVGPRVREADPEAERLAAAEAEERQRRAAQKALPPPCSS